MTEPHRRLRHRFGIRTAWAAGSVTALLVATVAIARHGPSAGEPAARNDHGSFAVIMYDGDVPVFAALDGSGHLPAGHIVAVAPNPTVRLSTAPAERPMTSQQTAVDASASWWLASVGGSTAWGVSTGKGIVVAVIDTGVDTHHPELAAATLPGMDFVAGGAMVDPNGHGTHVAGIIAAAHDGSGTSGLAPGARILPVRVLDASGSGDHVTIANGITWAVDAGAQVVNLSLGGPSSPVLAKAVEYAIARGAVVVAAAGNSGGLLGNARSYPAAYSAVIAVAATSPDDRTALFSSSGPHVDVAAPGFAIRSTAPGGGYAHASGTSQAAPFVAAAAALLLANGTQSGDVAARLAATARDIDVRGRDDRSGAGTLDAARALTGTPTPPPLAGVEPIPVVPVESLPGEPRVLGAVAAPHVVATGTPFDVLVQTTGCVRCVWQVVPPVGQAVTFIPSPNGTVVSLRTSAAGSVRLVADGIEVARTSVSVKASVSITTAARRSGRVEIRGTASGEGTVVLETLRDGSWKRVAAAPVRNGRFLLRTTARTPAFYRVVYATSTTQPRRV